MVIKKGPIAKKASAAPILRKNTATGKKTSTTKFQDSAQEDNNENEDQQQQQKTHVPEDHEIPTSDQLASAKASLIPFVTAKTTDNANSIKASASNNKSDNIVNRAQQLLEQDTDGAMMMTMGGGGGGGGGDSGEDDGDDMDDFETGILQSREAHEQSQTKKDLIAEARMRRGLEVTEIADRVDIAGLALFGKKIHHQQPQQRVGADSAPALSSSYYYHSNHRFWGHNRNAITCVAATPPDLLVNTKLGQKRNGAGAGVEQEFENPEDIDIQAETNWSSGSKMLCCFGDKSGRTWVILDDSTAEKTRVALQPPQRGPVLCVAISDAPPGNTLSNERISLVATKMERYIIASGGSDGTIYFWSGITLEHRGQVNLHRQPVTGLAFRAGTHTLYSVSKDAVLRVWDTLEAPARSVDKLYGHASAALCVASSNVSFLESANTTRQTAGGGRCVSGGDDRVPRVWKIETATESEFREPIPFRKQEQDADSSSPTAQWSAGAIEACCVVGTGGANNLAFVVGTTNGTLALYDANKRTALWLQERAHGSDVQGDGTGLEIPMREIEKDLQRELIKKNNNSSNNNNQNENQNHQDDASASSTTFQSQLRKSGAGNPITALAAVPCGDVVASGSGDGYVRLWKVTFDEGRVTRVGVASTTKVPARLDLLCEIKTPGWVNGLSFTYSGGSSVASKSNQWYLYVTSSKEQRLGRWTVFSKVLNGVLRFPLLMIGKDGKTLTSSSTGALKQLQQRQQQQRLPHQNDDDDDDDNENGSDDDEDEQKSESDDQDFESSVKAQKSLSSLRSKFLQTPEKRTMTRTQKQKLNRKEAKSSLAETKMTTSSSSPASTTSASIRSKRGDDQTTSASSSQQQPKKMTLEEKKKKLLLLRKKAVLGLKKK